VIDLDVSERFDSTQLDREFRLLGLGPDEQTLAPPPSKRRKLDSKPSLLEELTTNVCSLLGSHDVTNLHGLSQIIEYVDFYHNIEDKYLT
jgi:hypothetical protein